MKENVEKRTIGAARSLVKRLVKKHDLDIDVMRESWSNPVVEIEIGSPVGYSFDDNLHWLVHEHSWLEEGYTSLLHQAWDHVANRLPQYLPLTKCGVDCDCKESE
tara:strand:+ start:472 stop:786 length:315 start_codon:yes stop_codon:yes gene_type:complete